MSVYLAFPAGVVRGNVDATTGAASFAVLDFLQNACGLARARAEYAALTSDGAEFCKEVISICGPSSESPQATLRGLQRLLVLLQDKLSRRNFKTSNDILNDAIQGHIALQGGVVPARRSSRLASKRPNNDAPPVAPAEAVAVSQQKTLTSVGVQTDNTNHDNDTDNHNNPNNVNNSTDAVRRLAEEQAQYMQAHQWRVWRDQHSRQYMLSSWRSEQALEDMLAEERRRSRKRRLEQDIAAEASTAQKADDLYATEDDDEVPPN